MTVKETVDSAIADHKIVIFAKSYCPHCKAAKKLLIDDLELGDEVTVYELDQLADGTERQDYLLEKTGQRTVPNIFISEYVHLSVISVNEQPVIDIQIKSTLEVTTLYRHSTRTENSPDFWPLELTVATPLSALKRKYHNIIIVNIYHVPCGGSKRERH
ncbi:Glutaredoxin-1 [Tulasnella sp. JGI-2019a]|nr:Glutaredoxin-1 [Tulasnella sp. JGI-2019a]